MDFEKPITVLMTEMGDETGFDEEEHQTPDAFPELDLAGVEATTPVEVDAGEQATLAFDFPEEAPEPPYDPFAGLTLGSALDEGLNESTTARVKAEDVSSNISALDETPVERTWSEEPPFDDGFAAENHDVMDEAPLEPAPVVGASVADAPSRRKVLEREPDPENVLIISVIAKSTDQFDGAVLQKIIDACGMSFGDMSIYHRFEDEEGPSAVQFSMANALPPGTFEPDDAQSLTTKAVMFFMSMEEPRDVMDAFECMLATAETVAKHLGGEMLDENRSVLRTQTMEHYRQRVRDFEMKNLKKRGR
jgi:cell division protein ZipA